jgi:CheY-like chemotaxis protein
MSGTRPVLVVEDDALMQDAVRDVLETAGYPVLVADNAQAALRRLETEEPALIVLDMVLPGITGWGFLAQWREDPRLVTIPVVVMSGLVDPAHAAELMGAAGFLRKPFTPDQLIQAVDQHGSFS